MAHSRSATAMAGAIREPPGMTRVRTSVPVNQPARTIVDTVPVITAIARDSFLFTVFAVARTVIRARTPLPFCAESGPVPNVTQKRNDCHDGPSGLLQCNCDELGAAPCQGAAMLSACKIS